ncbi:unnamed protein product [Rhizophagus irregularis]|nr:unnamed protein product [Rhizophagus irregularis]
MSQRLKWINVPYRSDLQTRVMYLDSYYTHFIYACGRENTWRKKYLEINGDAVGTWPDSHSFYMYFDNLEQWKEAKCWVKKMYFGVLEL